ncbi:outer membrane protein assembly factor BamA [Oceanicola sp. S124]|uniref:outer membrane protein assembly factor BamA n=1 Tax=Oceanicola sp. S124 TaxID=1042378 RepID=UPI00025578E8|nr:outer membrane protein assembly factor BamA [Oceanicola sp. S124]
MTNTFGAGAATSARRNKFSFPLAAAIFAIVSGVSVTVPEVSLAQSYRFSTVSIEGNRRIPAATIMTYAGIAQGQSVSAAELNDAYQNIVNSGLFETVELTPRGGTLVIEVTEFPTINRISFEGNRRIKDDALSEIVQSTSRQVFSPTKAEADAALISEAYVAQGRLAARVTPRIIRRSDNRVDLVFEVFEGGNTEVERISFVGNTDYSDRRLRQVLQSKQAGLLRAFFRSDTFVADRIEFDKQVLQDFYQSRGYVDFRITGVNAELARERDGYTVTFNVQEGQQFKVGQVTTVSEYEGVDAAIYQEAQNLKSGDIYSPSDVENAIARMERQANRDGRDFLRIEPRITRNDRTLTLDVEFVLSRGPRIFVERIDIEGNTTTLDRVIRQQFNVAEGDPFNPREIRESAERIRALGYFSNAEVNAREGTRPDQVIVDVDVEEAPTGSLSFGGTYSTTDGFGLQISFRENNFLGRGQTLGVTLSGASDDRTYAVNFVEPRLLGRDLALNFGISYAETESSYSDYNTLNGSFTTGLTFPLTDKSRLNVNYKLAANDITLDTGVTIGSLLTAEAAEDLRYASSLGYRYSFDTRLSGLNPNAGLLLEFAQDFGGVGGDIEFIRSTGRAVAQTKVWNEEITLRATVKAGTISMLGGSNSQVTDRFLIGSSIMRGFTPDGIGPRQYSDGNYDDALGGTAYAVAQFDAEFPLGLPEELGISGGVFYDIGSAWGLDQTAADVLYEDASLRQVVGLSLFWNTPIGPLRFNWSHALQKEEYDKEQTFDLSIRTEF